jgi:hypothetical protein
MNTLVFKSKKEATEFLNARDDIEISRSGEFYFPSGIYYLAHGEYSKPDYVPRRYKDGWGIHRTVYFLPGTCYAPKDGRVDINTFVD